MLEEVEIIETSAPKPHPDLTPIFDEKGLIPCVAQDVRTKEVLQFEWMDRRSFERTVSTGLAHYFINHRKGIWRRYPRPVGRYPVKEMLLNEEQTCLLLLVEVIKNEHSNRLSNSSFHREFDWQD